MKHYDISQEIFTCAVYPGDPSPAREVLASLDAGDVCNLTAFSMCAHNGTHIDAPYHFLHDGNTVDGIALERLIGYAYLTHFDGIITAEHIQRMLADAQVANPESAKRILVGGRAELSFAAAEVLAAAGVYLFGNESQTVGPESAPMAVHKILLSADVVLLEGVRLAHVPRGVYLLHAAPINLGGADGAPCRATLTQI